MLQLPWGRQVMLLTEFLFKMKKTISFLLIAFPGILYAGDTLVHQHSYKWYQPDVFKVQYAGGIGFISVGVGKQYCRNRIQSSIFYGYVPSFKSEVPVHTLAQNNMFLFREHYLNKQLSLIPFVGFGESITVTLNDDKTFIKKPIQFPDNYYPQNAIRIGIFTGIILKQYFKHSSLTGIDFSIGTITNDLYISYAIMNKNTGLQNIFTMSAGITLYL